MVSRKLTEVSCRRKYVIGVVDVGGIKQKRKLTPFCAYTLAHALVCDIEGYFRFNEEKVDIYLLYLNVH